MPFVRQKLHLSSCADYRSQLYTLVLDKGDGQAQVNLNGGTGTIQMAADIAKSDVILQTDSSGDLIVKLRDTTDSITVAHDLVAQWWGTSSQVNQISFADGSTLAVGQPTYNSGPAPTFTWLGTAGDDTLTGSALGNNTFEGGAGNDTLNGGGGYDTYNFTSDLGQSTINNLASDSSSAKGEIDFTGVAHDYLWFARSGNDLQIDLLGTNQDVTISGWYAGNARPGPERRRRRRPQGRHPADPADQRHGNLYDQQPGLQSDARDANAHRPDPADRHRRSLALAHPS